MKIGNSLGWDVDRSVGDKFGRGNNVGIDSGIETKSGSDNVEGVG